MLRQIPLSKGSFFYSPPYRDYHHFTGRQKPWIQNDTKPQKIWFHTLQKVVYKYHLIIDIGGMIIRKPSLVIYQNWFQMYQVI